MVFGKYINRYYWKYAPLLLVGLAALIAGILLAWFGGSLFQVAVLACVVVFVLELIL